jgi:hypothetical protein
LSVFYILGEYCGLARAVCLLIKYQQGDRLRLNRAKPKTFIGLPKERGLFKKFVDNYVPELRAVVLILIDVY